MKSPTKIFSPNLWTSSNQFESFSCTFSCNYSRISEPSGTSQIGWEKRKGINLKLARFPAVNPGTDLHGISWNIIDHRAATLITICYHLLRHVTTCCQLASSGFRSLLSPLELRYSIYVGTKTLLANRDHGDPHCTPRMSWTQGEHTIRIRSSRNGSFSAHWLRIIGTWSIYT